MITHQYIDVIKLEEDHRTGNIKFLKFIAFRRILKPLSMAQDFACTFSGDESIASSKLIYPAASRNQEPILQVLKRFLSDVDNIEDEESPLFLEIASGSGQHVGYFAPNFPGIRFQPSDFDENLLGSINCYSKTCSSKNILPPIQVDICKKLSCYGFEVNSVDYMYCSNMIHISPFECTIGLFENAGNYLKPDALLITYGPYSKDGVITPDSNIAFNASLKARNPAWGLRDISDLIKLAEQNNMSLMDTIEMPANNKTLIWRRN